jgi:hypothetical protein
VDKPAGLRLFMSVGVTIQRACANVFQRCGMPMSIADTYRSMSEDVRRLADETENEAARDAYLALAELWRERSIRLESGVVSTNPDRCD